MIPTLLQLSWLGLKRDRVALAMVFVLPIMFFSVFALVFSAAGDSTLGSVDVLVIDRDQSAASLRLTEALRVDPLFQLQIQPTSSDNSGGASNQSGPVLTNRFPTALEIPRGFQATMGNVSPEVGLNIIYDPTDQPTRWILASGVQDAIRRAFPEAIALNQLATRLDKTLPPEVEASLEDSIRSVLALMPELSNRTPPPPPPSQELWTINFVESDAITNNPAAYYAAGTAVMFLLFSMAGAGSSLIEESEAGTLERLLNTGVTIERLLFSKWLFFSLVAYLQVTAMFLWASLFFEVKLGPSSRILGLLVITAFTAGGAAAFGILLGALCRSRAQLSGISTITILIMSALGGSMVPRFAMPEFMEKVALLTFNGWALDGYLKALWWTEPTLGSFAMLLSMWPQIVVLALFTFVCLVLACRFGRRWEMA